MLNKGSGLQASGLASPRNHWENCCMTDGEGRVRPGGGKSHRPGEPRPLLRLWPTLAYGT